MDFDLKNINYDQFLEVSSIVKIIALFVLFLFVMLAGYFLDTQSQLQFLNDTTLREDDLKTQLMMSHARLFTLTEYKKQSKILTQSFNEAMKQLPQNSEIPKLLDNINKIGLDNGLEFKLFKPLEEEKTQYYATIPVKIIIIGNYHQFGYFVSQLMNLSRVLSVQDFTIEELKPENATVSIEHKLIMGLTLYTYRNLSESEIKSALDAKIADEAKHAK